MTLDADAAAVAAAAVVTAVTVALGLPPRVLYGPARHQR
jgi:hypothetical protein